MSANAMKTKHKKKRKRKEKRERQREKKTPLCSVAESRGEIWRQRVLFGASASVWILLCLPSAAAGAVQQPALNMHVIIPVTSCCRPQAAEVSIESHFSCPLPPPPPTPPSPPPPLPPARLPRQPPATSMATRGHSPQSSGAVSNSKHWFTTAFLQPLPY